MLGYSSMLVAAKVDPENPWRAAKIINSHPGVSHNYLRDHDFNLWFTIATEPDSPLGLEGTLELLERLTGRRVGAPAARRCGCSRSAWTSRWRRAPTRSPRPREAEDHQEPEAIELSELDVAVIRATQGPMEVAPEPYAPAAAELGISQEALLEHLESMRERRALRRVAAILFHRRAGFSANGMGVWSVPEERILELGPRMASFRGISHCYQRPTYADWPYSVFTMAHGRSKEECDAILDSIADDTGIEDRRTLYSSTEFKKIRLRYFTDEHKRWEAEHSLTEQPLGGGSTPARSELLPGGVNSPVRAMRSIGRDPIFVARGEGAELVDVDGNRYVDWVMSWGPLIAGHAHPDVVAAVTGRRRGRHQLRRAHRGGGRARGGGGGARALGGDGAHDLVGHRGLDERPAAGARGHRARHDRQVRRRLPRPRGRAAGRGRLGSRHAGHPREPGRHRRAGGRHDRGALERPRGGGAARSPSTRWRRSSASPTRPTWASSRPSRASWRSCARRPRRRAPCSCSTR